MISKTESLFNGFFTRIGVTEIQFPWYLPNINGESHSIQVLVAGAGQPTLSGTALLSIGFYTPTELAAAFATAVDGVLYTLGGNTTALGTITCTYSGPQSSTSVPLPVTQNIPYSFEIIYTPGTNPAYTTIAFGPDPTKLSFNNLFSLMSFIPATASQSPATPGGTSFNSTFFTAPSDCLYTPYIDIVSRRLVAYQNLYDTTTAPVTRNIICRLYLNTDNNALPTTSTYWNGTAAVTAINDPVLVGQRPATIYRQFRTPKLLKYVSDVPVGQLDFQVYDSLGNPLDNVFNTTYAVSGNYQIPDYQMTLLASEN
jgi:hypothetical protein